MRGLRLLNSGEWNKPPVLTAARQVFALGLARAFPHCTLGDAASFVNGTSYDVDRVSIGAPIPIIRISNLTDPNSAYIRTDEALGAKFLIRPGDLLVSWSASFKTAIWAGPQGYLNQHIFKVTETSGFDRRYIRHIIEASFDAMQERVVGIGMMHLRRADFLGHSIPAPPPSIQAAVAAYLDWMESGRVGTEPPLPSELAEQRRVVARIEALAEQILDARRQRKSATEDAVALLASARRHFMSGLDCEIVPLEQVCTSIIDNLHSNPRLSESGIPCIRSPDVGYGSLNVESAQRTDDDEYRRRTIRGEPQADDIVFVREGGGTGKCAVVMPGQRFSLGQRVMMLRPNTERILPRFLLHQLLSPLIQEDQIGPLCKGSASPHLNISSLKRFDLRVPTLSVQNSVVAELDGLEIKLNAASTLQSNTAAELDALLPAILDRAFKGELV